MPDFFAAWVGAHGLLVVVVIARRIFSRVVGA
jgi:hypothetical protein